MNEDEKILFVDDNVNLLESIKRSFHGRFNIFTAASGNDGLDLLDREGPFTLVVSDYKMPAMNGVEFLEKIHEKYPDTIRMMLTGEADIYAVIDVINKSTIFRFINKPCPVSILGEILEKGLEQYRLVNMEKRKNEEIDTAYKQLLQYAKALNETVSNLKNKNRELNNAYYDTINRLVVASEYKDEDTHDHIVRMSRYSALLAEKAGFSGEFVENILFASPMHDIGKIGIPDTILMKPGKLADDEFNNMKKHTIIGSKILENSKAEILKLAASIALTHHEKWNGKGYPYGTSGEEIPVAGRIAAIADTFDALTSKRPYKEAYPVEVAYDIIIKEKGRQFDPDITDIFIDNFNDFITIKEEISAAGPDSGNFAPSERDCE